MDADEMMSTDSMVTDSNEAVEFKMIRDKEDLENDSLAFKPLMSHQIFGSQESIFGYKNLKVKLYFSAACLNPFLSITFSDKIDPEKHGGVEADNIHEILNRKLEIQLNENLDEFISSLEKESQFVPPGELIETFTMDVKDLDQRDGAGKQKTYVVYYGGIMTPHLIAYHKRLQTFVLWFIDAASFINTDDDKWKFFLMFEKYKVNGETRYAIVGYATVYEYFAYPKNIRPRISQVLILPLFQFRGLGAALLSSIYNHYKIRSEVRDITVEDPSEDLQLVRDFVDCKNCMELPTFQPEELWSKGFTSEMAQEAATKLKINKKQARRIYEILKLKTVDKHNQNQYREYRLEVKRRLNLPNQNEEKKFKKLELFLKPQEIAEFKASIVFNGEQRISNLDKSYRELEALYERVLNRISKQ